ncbi:hypothetical protein [Streptomyces roseochromogenus]|uniref:Uncharacterized protein n=1 Tax=Streptomyces roseochromogenus subsp. oscitans DS 12.976 TaxID=1352936 RepID=V6JE11_STRRC|nr:hypothetical protein [Streptomyces roseochromogenus]EST18070.1 hypothetical protein M878_45745 [Streptomyces roseochromogenus subsp. oscitans DS 12.976]
MKQLNSGEITLTVAVVTLVVNTVSMVIAVKDRKHKRRGRHRKG